LPDETTIRKFIKLTYPWIAFTKKIYVERTMNPITLEDILAEYEKGTINRLDSEKQSYIPQGKENYEEKFRDLFIKNPTRVSIRLLANKNLGKGPFISNRKAGSVPNLVSEVLLVHIHGGGFVSMSSRSHQNYTRKYIYIFISTTIFIYL
jgi:hormone-sensitive lipase